MLPFLILNKNQGVFQLLVFFIKLYIILLILMQVIQILHQPIFEFLICCFNNNIDSIINMEYQDNQVREQQGLISSKQPRSHSIKVNKDSKLASERTNFQNYKELLRVIFPYSLLIALTVVSIFLTAIIQGIIPYRLSILIKQPQMHQLKILLFIVMLNCIMQFIRKYLTCITSQVVLIYLRNHCFSQFLLNNMKFFEKNKVGNLITIVNTDIQTVRNMFTKTLFSFAKNVSKFLTMTVLLISLNYKLSIVFLSFIPIYIYINLLLTRISKKYSKQYSNMIGKTFSHVLERFRGILTSKTYSTQKFEESLFFEKISQVYKIGRDKSIYNSLLQSVSILIPNIGTLLAICFGYLYFQYSEKQLQIVSSFLLYTVNLSTTSANLSRKALKLTNGAASIERILNLLNYSQKKQQKNIHFQDAQISNGLFKKSQIQFRNVSFTYKESRGQVIRNFNISINKGQYLAIVGSSGSGKSTILKLLMGLYNPTSGQIICLFDNNKIAYVPQDTVIFSGTFKENIQYSNKELDDFQLQTICEQVGIWEFINYLPNKLYTKLGNKGIKLSGGQKQRIALARALSIRPNLLLLDQATASLDSRSEDEIYQVIKTISKKRNITIISIIHKFRRINDFDKIIVMNKGMIQSVGNHEKLINQNSIYKNLYELQKITL